MKSLKLLLLGLALSIGAASSAFAHDSVGFSINFGSPGYYAAPPVYYAPAPVYYARPQVIYYPSNPTYYYQGYGDRGYSRYYEPPRYERYREDGHHHWRHHDDD